MTNTSVLSKIVFGICVTTASLSSTGCATNKPMLATDLGSFQIDCKIKEQQIALLQSMRVTKDDRMASSLANVLQPWQFFTDPSQVQQRQSVQSGRTNWLINQNLQRLAYDCP